MYDELLEEVVRKTGMNKNEIEKMVIEKITELSNLITKEGAIYIVARELGIDLKGRRERRLRIKNIVPGLNIIDVYGRVIDIKDIHNYEKNGKKGKVGSFTIGDETSTIRVVLWNEGCEKMKNISIGNIVLIKNAYSVENKGTVELRIGKEGYIKTLNDNEIDFKLPNIDEIKNKVVSKKRSLYEVKESEGVSVQGIIVDFIKRRPYFEVCPICNGKITFINNKYICSSDGEVDVKKKAIATFILDDGTANIRCIAFGTTAEKIYGMNIEEMVKLYKNDSNKFFNNIKNKGSFIQLIGNVKMDEVNERLELIVSNIMEINMKNFIKNLLNNIKKLM